MIRDFVSAEGGRLVADEIGEGACTALFLHGGGQTRHAWGDTAQRLAQSGWRCISLDQRGHGDSDWSATGAYRFVDYAADARAVATVLEAESGEKPVAVGASLGGLSSLLAQGDGATDAPCFRALILVDIVPQMDPRGVEKIQGFMRAHAREGFADIAEAADAVARYLPHRPRPKSLDGLRKNLRQSPDGRWRWHWDPRFLEGETSVNAQWREAEALLHRCVSALSVPVLLLRGGASELVTPEAAQAFLDLAPHADYVDVEEARHMVAGDRNDVFSNAVETFLDRLERAI